MLEKCVLTVLELNWNKRLGHKKTKLNICHHMLTSSTQLQNRSFQVVERTRTSSKCQKMKYTRAKRAKILFSIVKYANLWGFCCRRRRACLSSLLSVSLERRQSHVMSKAAITIDYYKAFGLTKSPLFGAACIGQASSFLEGTEQAPLRAFIKQWRPVLGNIINPIKDGAYYCYCAYVLRIFRYSDFLSPMLTNTGIFLRGLKLSGESRS